MAIRPQVATAAAMAADPSSDASFQKGLALLLAGEAFDAHECWEELWLQAGGERARYLQGLIQLAVALYHWQCGRLPAAQRLRARGETKLRAAPDGARDDEPSSVTWLAWSTRCFAGLDEQEQTGEAQALPPSEIPDLPA